jgi:hypothetical protein
MEFQMDLQKAEAEKNEEKKKEKEELQSRETQAMNYIIIRKCLSTKEKDFWFRIRNKAISVRAKEKHWRKDYYGKPVSEKCVICKEEKETWKHYDMECRRIQEYKEEIAKEFKINTISEEKWNLRKENEDKMTMVIVAKARWFYHLRRRKIDQGKRKEIGINELVKIVRQEIEFIKEQNDNFKINKESKETKKKRKKERDDRKEEKEDKRDDSFSILMAKAEVNL